LLAVGIARGMGGRLWVAIRRNFFRSALRFRCEIWHVSNWCFVSVKQQELFELCKWKIFLDLHGLEAGEIWAAGLTLMFVFVEVICAGVASQAAIQWTECGVFLLVESKGDEVSLGFSRAPKFVLHVSAIVGSWRRGLKCALKLARWKILKKKLQRSSLSFF